MEEEHQFILQKKIYRIEELTNCQESRKEKHFPRNWENMSFLLKNIGMMKEEDVNHNISRGIKVLVFNERVL